MIAFPCPSCQKKLAVKDLPTDKKVKCPGCGQGVPNPGGRSHRPGRGTLPPDSPSDRQRRRRSTWPATRSGTNEARQSAHESRYGPARLHPGGEAFDGGHDSSLTDFLAPPQADDELGRLGKYRILKILGHGGMGVVFQAEDPRLKRSVAIKAMLPALAASASAGQRFLREAQAMAAVKHDHIVTIYQVDEERGVPFLAMELAIRNRNQLLVDAKKKATPSR